MTTINDPTIVTDHPLNLCFNSGMLTMNYRYRIYPNITQEQSLFEWMDVCRVAYNYGLREIKDWCNSRKCMVDRCSISHEYIMAADAPFPCLLINLVSVAAIGH